MVVKPVKTIITTRAEVHPKHSYCNITTDNRKWRITLVQLHQGQFVYMHTWGEGMTTPPVHWFIYPFSNPFSFREKHTSLLQRKLDINRICLSILLWAWLSLFAFLNKNQNQTQSSYQVTMLSVKLLVKLQQKTITGIPCSLWLKYWCYGDIKQAQSTGRRACIVASRLSESVNTGCNKREILHLE